MGDAMVAGLIAQTALSDDLDSYVARAMKTFEVPGLSIGIVKDRKVIIARGYGIRKMGESTPVDENTLFGIGSNTKAFTSAALATLVNTRGTTPFISANGSENGILWTIDQGQPLQSPQATTNATLYAYDATNLSNELYSSSTNSGDTPGIGIKFTSPIVANGKVYMSTAHDPLSVNGVPVTHPQGEIDVYGLK